MASDRNEEESRRILRRMAQESDPSGSLAARTVRRVQDHLSAAEADPDDKAELWGRRIGRFLGVVLLIVLIVYLISFIVNGY